MKIGGWMRAWVVLSILYACLVAFVAFIGRPTLSPVYDAWFTDASRVIASSIKSTGKTHFSEHYLQKAIQQDFSKNTNAKNVAFLKKAETSPTKLERPFSKEIASLNKKYRKKIAAFPHRETMYYLKAAAWWVGGILALFLAGWSIGWVIRGFRGRPA